MDALLMPRKQANYRLDDRVIKGLSEEAQDANLSINRFLENHLFDFLKTKGRIPQDAKPLGETRGGDRSTKDNTIDN